MNSGIVHENQELDGKRLNALFVIYELKDMEKKHSLKIKFDDKVVAAKDLNLFHKRSFKCKNGISFYFNAEQLANDLPPDIKSDQDKSIKWAKKALTRFFETKVVETLKKEMEKMTLNYRSNQELSGKTIRDAIYGDISIPKKYLSIIETKEFQRLQRIRQLATANFVYPNANHTRFSHSLGVFHITSKMIQHLEPHFKKCSINLSEEDVSAILLAALLHNIGHLPFSHALERYMKNAPAPNNFSHEKMAISIIKDADSEISKAIKLNFVNSETIIAQVCKYIDNSDSGFDAESVGFAFKKILNSQIDADRIDFLLRDALNCGVKYANLDIDRLISSIELTTTKNGDETVLDICHHEKYLSDIENFLISRYRMYENVYYDSYKLMTEALLSNILTYVKEHNIPSDSRIQPIINKDISPKSDAYHRVSLFRFANILSQSMASAGIKFEEIIESKYKRACKTLDLK